MLWRRPKVSLHDAALVYAELGVPVFPCHWPTAASPRRSATAGCSCQLLACSFPGEHPLVPDWLDAATTERAQIDAWWFQHPLANVGLLTGVAFDVVDIPGELLGRVPPTAMPDGPVADTGTGRRHYFVAPSGRGNTALPARSTGIRQRLYRHGRGGYVLAAPSRHVGGGTTHWLRPLTAPVPDAPPHALAAMASSPRSRRSRA